MGQFDAVVTVYEEVVVLDDIVGGEGLDGQRESGIAVFGRTDVDRAENFAFGVDEVGGCGEVSEEIGFARVGGNSGYGALKFVGGSVGDAVLNSQGQGCALAMSSVFDTYIVIPS